MVFATAAITWATFDKVDPPYRIGSVWSACLAYPRLGRRIAARSLPTMPPILNKKLKRVASALHTFQARVPIELRTIGTEQHYQTMVEFLDELIDEIGERESHPLIGLLDIVSLFVRDYEDRTGELPALQPNGARRVMRRTNRAIITPTKESSRARASAKADSAILYRKIKLS